MSYTNFYKLSESMQTKMMQGEAIYHLVTITQYDPETDKRKYKTGVIRGATLLELKRMQTEREHRVKRKR